ncbi:hypothetical protein [Caulobacter sp. 17J65-9]|uniref:hypothetical protein n=1 Tax=Caulobacter sp. 17J65-9 TaxID=2709382 RepID=UPI0013C9C3AC|nr:hypothetical protein [Caulobacter sp. 17J65-9]NEX94650.1 hypothetical protein [Caulobacter sp. 17J65-9]
MKDNKRNRLVAVVFAAALAISGSSAPAQAQGVKFSYMGEMSCGAWPKHSPYTAIDKALTLNWVLGFISGRSSLRERDMLATVDIASVSAWMDNYCAEHPLDTVIMAAHALEKELLARAPAIIPTTKK